MRRIRIVGLCLVAVFAVSAVVAANASAISFAKPAGGFPILFLSHGGLAKWETVGGQAFHCTAVDNHGLIENADLGKVLVLPLGCITKVGGSTFKCSNTSNSEDVHMTLHFHLGLTLPDRTPALLLLLPGGEFKFQCTALAKITFKGEVIGLLREVGGSPLKTETEYSEAALAFGETGGKQNDQTFDLSLGGGEMKLVHLTQSLNGGAAEEMGIEMLDTLDGFKAGGASTKLKILN